MVTEELNIDEAENCRKGEQQQHRLTEHDRKLAKEFGPTSLNVVNSETGHAGQNTN